MINETPEEAVAPIIASLEECLFWLKLAYPGCEHPAIKDTISRAEYRLFKLGRRPRVVREVDRRRRYGETN